MRKCSRRTNLKVEESEAPIPRRSSSHIRYPILLPAFGVFVLMAMISSMVFSNPSPDDEPKAVNETLARDHVPNPDHPLAGLLGNAPSTTNNSRELQIAKLSIEDGGTLLGALAEQGIAHKEAYAASLALESVFDPKTLKAGQVLTVGLRTRNNDDDKLHLDRLTFVPKTDRKIVIEHQNDERFEAAVRPIQHTAKAELAAGTISTSLYEAALSEGIPTTVILETYRLLGHAVDFQRDIRAGDKFALGYERYDDGDAGGTHPGELLFASIGLSNGVVRFLRYTTRDGYSGFFDSEGRSADTAFLKTPVDSGRLSSLFGKRDHPILGYNRMHKGLDFSAPLGAIVVAARDGIVSKRERNGGFGNYVQIEHSGDYATAYAHLSRYAAGLNAGDRVRQGETIGYVGATGLATGPNLHYEVLHNGAAIDPVSVNSPPQKVLAGEELERLQDAFSEFEFSQVSAGFRKLVQAEHRAETRND